MNSISRLPGKVREKEENSSEEIYGSRSEHKERGIN